MYSGDLLIRDGAAMWLKLQQAHLSTEMIHLSPGSRANFELRRSGNLTHLPTNFNATTVVIRVKFDHEWGSSVLDSCPVFSPNWMST
jgi:hypothetical protein